MKPIVSVIDDLTSWAKEHICNKIQLKVPPDNSAAVDSGYAYKLENPEAFPMYLPPSDKLPKGMRFTHPSLCVRFLKSGDSSVKDEGYVDIQFVFSVWDPGDHGEDLFFPTGDGSYIKREDSSFEKGSSGWRDVWNFVDIARRALESTTSIKGIAIDKNTDIEYGPVTEQEAIVDAYPYWYSWLSFRVTYPLMRNNEDVEKYL